MCIRCTVVCESVAEVFRFIFEGKIVIFLFYFYLWSGTVLKFLNPPLLLFLFVEIGQST